MSRSNRPDVRNPMLALPSVRRLASLGPVILAPLIDALREIEADARARAEKCWRSHKAPMAFYWKVVAVYARHGRAALNRLFKEGGLPL